MRERDVSVTTEIFSRPTEFGPVVARLLGGVLALGLASAPADIRAQSPLGADRGGFAGPAGDSARAIGANPAAMGAVDGFSLDLDHTLKIRSQSADIDGERAEMVALHSDPRIAAASDVGTDWLRVGIAGAIPRRYGSDWPTGGPQRYDSIFHRTRGIDLRGALAGTPVDWLTVGGSVGLIQAEYRSYRAADVGKIVARQRGADPSTVPDRAPGNEGREFLEFTGRTVAWSAGVSFTPGDVRIGVAYHGPVPLDLEGSYELYVPRNDYYRERYGGDVNRDASLSTEWPDRIEAGAAWELGEGHEVFAGAEWVRWSGVDAVDIDVDEGEDGRDFDRREARDLRDAVSARLGGTYRLSETFALDATVGVSTSPTPDRRATAEVIDATEARAAVGLQWRVVDSLTLRTGYQHVHSFARETGPIEGRAGTAGTYRQDLGLVETSLSFDL